MNKSFLAVCIALNLLCFSASAQTNKEKKDIAVIAYYAGRPDRLDSFAIEKLTHLIFCFGHLKGNRLHIGSARDTAAIQKMVALKSRNPNLKIILSLGGWGGCKTCSPVFTTRKGRKEFAKSVKEINDYFGTDGIDLDWEYPAIEGPPGHPFSPEDKPAFTHLVKQLRKKLGKKNEISFAAGGFTAFIDSSVEWKKVMKIVDRVNLMSYDLVNGYTTKSGHHTPLYSTPDQKESTDHGVQMMLAAGVPADKIVVGAAFYARLYEVNDTLQNGLYRPGRFLKGLSFNRQADTLSTDNGFIQYWDSTANAPYSFNAQRRLMASYDNRRSVELKTRYVIEHQLNGIMFWQLGEDTFKDGLLDAIDKTRRED
ncbi:MAG TPA: glycosyl hydrolase family 18 protein [Agriterribacter sp.]|nr:glycosyl hydrolase family 18 protein [Agriterribacter sp.]